MAPPFKVHSNNITASELFHFNESMRKNDNKVMQKVQELSFSQAAEVNILPASFSGAQLNNFIAEKLPELELLISPTNFSGVLSFEAGGHCFFHSVTAAINGMTTTAAKLRRKSLDIVGTKIFESLHTERNCSGSQLTGSVTRRKAKLFC